MLLVLMDEEYWQGSAGTIVSKYGLEIIRGSFINLLLIHYLEPRTFQHRITV